MKRGFLTILVLVCMSVGCKEPGLVEVREDSRLGRTFTTDGVACGVNTAVRWDLGDGTKVWAAIGDAVSHPYPIGGTYNVNAESACRIYSTEVFVEDLYVPYEEAVYRVLELLTAPEIPGDTLPKGQYDNFRSWDWLVLLLEGEELPVPLPPQFAVDLLKIMGKPQLSLYLGAPVDLIEIPKDDVLDGVLQLFLLRYLELSFEAARDAEGTVAVSPDGFIEAALESHLAPEENRQLIHVRNNFRWFFYVGSDALIQEEYTLDETLEVFAKGLIILAENMARWLTDEQFAEISRDVAEIDTVSNLIGKIKHVLKNDGDPDDARQILETVYFLAPDEIDAYRAEYCAADCDLSEAAVTENLFDMGKRRADDGLPPVVGRDVFLDLEELQALFDAGDLDALYLINRLGVGSLSVGVAFFTHINETLDSDLFEEYFETKPEENDLVVIRKSILAFAIMYYRYFKVMPDPLLSTL
jgi:hypothetical protein